MKFAVTTLLCLCFAASFTACRSTGKKEKEERDPEIAALTGSGPVRPQIGAYYRMKRGLNGFYPRIPTFVETVPPRVLTGGHVVQLLDPNAGGGWARVKNEKLEIGYVRLENIRIVPPEKRPGPFKRDPDEELERNMGLR